MNGGKRASRRKRQHTTIKQASDEQGRETTKSLFFCKLYLVLDVFPGTADGQVEVLGLDLLATGEVASSDLGVDLDLRVLLK